MNGQLTGMSILSKPSLSMSVALVVAVALVVGVAGVCGWQVCCELLAWHIFKFS